MKRPEDPDPSGIIRRYVDGDVSAEEWARIASLIRADKSFARLFVRQMRLATVLRGMMKAECAVAAWREQPARAWRWGRRILPLAAAAGLMAMLAGGALLALLWSEPYARVLAGELRVLRDGKTLQLKPGERLRKQDDAAATSVATCRLRDGSVVKMDKGSHMLFGRPARDERAHLVLRDGRIFLRVARAKQRFVISSSHGELVEALGTVFGVETKMGGVAVSVLRGRVALSSDLGGLQIGNGQSAQAAAGKKPMPTDVDPNQVLLWARDKTVFQQRPLGEVVDWIEANSSYSIAMSPSFRQETVTITIAEPPMEDVIEVLCLICGATREVNGNAVMIRKLDVGGRAGGEAAKDRDGSLKLGKDRPNEELGGREP